MWGYGPYGMMGYGGGWGAMPMMLFGGIFWVILLVLGVWAFLHYTRGSRQGGGYWPGGERGSSALDILEERYAHGEIEREEYLQKKQDLLGGGRGK